MTKRPKLRCVDCLIHGKHRLFATVSGYSSHLENYHGAKIGEKANFLTETEPEPDERALETA